HDDTIGHGWALDFLRRVVDADRVGHAYLLTGPAHIGKTHLATRFAAMVNCIGTASPCGVCTACVKTFRGTHPDVILIEPDGDHVKIDQIRRLQYHLSLSPLEGRRRVCIITDLHTATLEASNALLKTLEEPPSRVILIATATDAGLLLPTIVSRCQTLSLRAVPADEIERAILARWPDRPDDARLVARLAAGRVGWALRAMDDAHILAERRERLDELREILRQGRAGRIRAAERLSRQDDLLDTARLWQSWWRDVMLLHGGCSELLVNDDEADALRQVADQCDLTAAQKAIRSIEACMQQLDQNVNARLALEVMLLSWGRVHVTSSQV
ncbi:MAG: ATP-binding protein, partial [Anaerolineae bacterium]